MKYKSKAIPVEATQWFKTGDHTMVTAFEGRTGTYNGIINHVQQTIKVEPSDWIVEFPNKEVHVVEDAFFKMRFDHVESFTKKELSYAALLAASCDCI